MPYILKDKRPKFNDEISALVNSINTSGELNYVLSSIVWIIFSKDRNYETANGLLGVLDAVSKEFYRRKVAPYEDEKIVAKENGDLQVK